MREHSESAQHHGNLYYLLEVPDNLPPLSAAVEVAAYRIALEAMTNVHRHAQASTCIVRICPDKDAHNLCVEVIDNGRGVSMKQSAGVGLTAMRERALELGGRFTIETPSKGGTHVQVELPLS